MKNYFLPLTLLIVAGCTTTTESEKQIENDPRPPIVNIHSNIMDIVMQDTLTSGLNHIIYENRSDMTHFLLFNKVPKDVDLSKYHEELTMPFQELMASITESRESNAVFPEWLPQMVNMGGVGLLSPGQKAESYVDFEPGNYIVECYVKTNGIFHSTTGMLKQVTIISNQEIVNTPNLDPVATVNVDSLGLTTIGDLPNKPGDFTFKVNYENTRLFPNFTRPDVHLVRITEDAGLDKLEDYMDWTTPNGMDANAPVMFLGGTQEMPKGSIAYFKQNLEAGKYILIGEVPNPKENNFYVEFEILE